MPATHQYSCGASSTPAPGQMGKSVHRGKGRQAGGLGRSLSGVGTGSSPSPFPQPHLCSLSRRYFSRSALLIFSRGCRWSWCVFTFWLST